MEKMDMHSSNEYVKVLRGRYLKAKGRKEKSRILDEYCNDTGQVLHVNGGMVIMR